MNAATGKPTGARLPVDSSWSKDVPLLVSSKPEGTGLGLSIARDIAAAHGGAITFARGVEGTVVTVALPRGADDALPARRLSIA